jgi:hypothetical protein
MSWTSTAARSAVAPLTAILNLRGRKANSGCSVDHWRMSSHHGRGVDDLVGRDAGEGVAGRIAHAVATGLDRVHPDLGELGEDLGRVDEARPVELDVLPGGEVAVAAIVAAGDVRELAQLR